MRLASPWTPRLAAGDAPPAERLAAALEEDILAGRVPPGARLPAQRDLAWRLGIGLGSVTKAYGALQRRGLARAAHGRGVFVAEAPGAPDPLVDLAANAPPACLSRRLVAGTLVALAKRLDPERLAAYGPVAGRVDDRRLMAGWLAGLGYPADPDRLLLTNGAQQALTVAFRVCAPPGGAILTEALGYPGAIAFAREAGYRLVPVACDGEGLRPDALEAALARAARGGARTVLYVTPTLHNPTTATMSAGRRAEVVRLARRHDALVIEDDVYALSADDPPTPLACLAPERVFHVSSLSKVLSPGLRIGALAAPPGLVARAERVLAASATMVSPLSCAVLAHWLETGEAARIRDAIRAEAARRVAIAAGVFARAGLADAVRLPPTDGFHAFAPLASEEAERIAEAAAAAGVRVTPPAAIRVDPQAAGSGLRLCLGAPALEDLARGLAVVAGLMRDAGAAPRRPPVAV